MFFRPHHLPQMFFVKEKLPEVKKLLDAHESDLIWMLL